MKELNSTSRAVLRELGVSDGPSASDRDRVRRRLMVTLAGSTAALSAKAAPLAAASVEAPVAAAGTSLAAAAAPTAATGLALANAGLSGKAVALWLVGGGFLGAAFSGSAAMIHEYTSKEAVASARPVAARPLAPLQVARSTSDREPSRDRVSPDVPERSISTQPTNPSKGRVSGPRSTLSAGVPPTIAAPRAETKTSISQELSLLSNAQRELANGDASASLRLLDDHARHFPDGTLSAERTAARVFVLCALGRTGEARALAREFLAATPSSPLVPRVLASCAGNERP